MNQENVIQLTEVAAKHLADMIANEKGGIGFRIGIKKTGCSGYMYAPEIVHQERDDDIRIDTDQAISVFIDYQWVSILQGTLIDLVDEKLGQKRLIFKNPNVNDECGCGESFSIPESHE